MMRGEGLRWVGRRDNKETQETVGGEGYVRYLDCGGHFTGV